MIHFRNAVSNDKSQVIFRHYFKYHSPILSFHMNNDTTKCTPIYPPVVNRKQTWLKFPDRCNITRWPLTVYCRRHSGQTNWYNMLGLSNKLWTNSDIYLAKRVPYYRVSLNTFPPTWRLTSPQTILLIETSDKAILLPLPLLILRDYNDICRHLSTLMSKVDLLRHGSFTL